MASGMIAGAALAGALSWFPWPHHNPPAHAAEASHRHDKHLPKATVPGEVGGARMQTEAGLVLVPVKIKDRGPFMVVLDTGAAHSSIDAKVAYQIGADSWGENASPPSTARAPVARKLQALSFDLGDAKLFSAEPRGLYKPFNLPSHARGRLGFDALGGYAVRIDPRYRLVTIHDPMRMTKPINSVTLPLTVTSDGYFVPVTLRLADGTGVQRNVKLDTGMAWTMADDAATVSKLSAVEVGPWTIPQTAGHGPGVGAPAISMNLLNGFIVTIDAPDKLVFLQSTGAYRPDFQYTAHDKAVVQAAPAPTKKKKRFVIF